MRSQEFRFMDVVFFQTADAHRYAPILAATSRTVIRYCDAQSFHYQSFLGVKRGYWPWQASFNRIYIFEELLAQDFYDWAVFLDSDAFVVDLKFDLRSYLEHKSAHSAVMTPSDATPNWWDVNNGVILLNLRHPDAALIVSEWKAAYETAFDKSSLWAHVRWSNPNDQDMIQRVLASHENLRQSVFMQSRDLMNAMDSTFIRQFVRESAPDLETRTRIIEQRVAELLDDWGEDDVAAQELKASEEREDLVVDAFIGHLGRHPDDVGRAHYIRMLKDMGREAGVARMHAEISGSEECRRRRL